MNQLTLYQDNMNSFFVYGIIFLILLVLELAYFKVADKFNIIDKPNERSSHSSIVLRGGGLFSYCRCGYGARSSGFSICGSCLR